MGSHASTVAGARAPRPDELLPIADGEDLRRGRPRTALVVEDDQDLLSTICEVLAERGIDARAARSAEEAIAQLEQGLRPEFVLLDFWLPGLSGEGLLLRLKYDDRWRSIRVAAMTVYPAEPFQLLGLADALLPKPFTLEALERLVTLLDRPARQPFPAATGAWRPTRGDA
jgi:CheY-like chemotaxis protein